MDFFFTGNSYEERGLEVRVTDLEQTYVPVNYERKDSSSIELGPSTPGERGTGVDVP